MTKKVAKSSKKTPPKKKKERKDWTEHHAVIRDAYVEIIKIKKRCPTLKELHEATNYASQTIRDHLAKLEFDAMKTDMRVLTPDVLLAIANTAKAGSSSSQKLFLQVMEGFSEQSNINHTNDGEKFDVMTPVVIGSIDGKHNTKPATK